MNDIERFNKSHLDGLSNQEVQLRKEQNLINTAQEKITKTTGQILRDNVFTTFNAFNAAIGICLALVGAWTNMAYLAIIILNIAIGIFQEIHAKKLVEKLSLLSALKADVVRNGNECEIPVEEIVLDDIAVLRMGKQVCADSVVIHGEIEVNESLLTGEADSVLKQPGDALLSGSFVVSGKCYAKVEHVGAENFVAKLAQGAKKHRKVNSELLRSMQKITKLTGFFIIPIGILLFIEAMFIRSDSVSIAVVSTAAALLGMLPKGLVLITSISVATGVIKLSKKKVLVQEMYCIETLAHVDMLCLDKTGTLTEGKMRVSNIHMLKEGILPVSAEQAMRYFSNAMEDNNATFMALKEYFKPDSTYIPIYKVPFSSQRKWSSVTFENFGTIVVGAPEKFSSGKYVLPYEMEEAVRSGQRILCVGFTKETLNSDILPDITPAAAVSISDPIRESAKNTLDFFKQESVDVRIISGDNPLTVSYIAKQAGLEQYDSYIDMSSVHTENEIKEAARKYNIFGRVTPQQKSMLVKAFQADGHTVAMTGDGVNDVLALREADCSIAIGAGSDAARQVSQLVLLESDFTSLPDIVVEGRRVVNNITRVAGVFFVKTIYSILLSIFSIFTVTAFPFIPIQITVIDAVIEAFPAFFLSFEPSRDRIKDKFLKTVIRRAFPFSCMILIGFLTLTWLAPVLNIEAESQTIIFYVTGFISLLALIRSCRPFNPLRICLCGISAVGFYAAIYLFAGIVHLERLSLHALGIFAACAAICIPFILLLTVLVNKLFRKVFDKRVES